MNSLVLNLDRNLEWDIIDVSQAVPNSAPPIELQTAISIAAFKAENHRYGAILGKKELREAIATKWNSIYESDITFEEVGITAGCNEAFCAAISAVAMTGDSVILPCPWYFNHKMWLDMQGINTILKI